MHWKPEGDWIQFTMQSTQIPASASMWSASGCTLSASFVRFGAMQMSKQKRKTTDCRTQEGHAHMRRQMIKKLPMIVSPYMQFRLHDGTWAHKKTMTQHQSVLTLICIQRSDKGPIHFEPLESASPSATSTTSPASPPFSFNSATTTMPHVVSSQRPAGTKSELYREVLFCWICTHR